MPSHCSTLLYVPTELGASDADGPQPEHHRRDRREQVDHDGHAARDARWRHLGDEQRDADADRYREHQRDERR